MNTLSLILHGKTDAYLRSLPDANQERIDITHFPSSSFHQNQGEQQRRPSLSQRSYTEYPSQVRHSNYNSPPTIVATGIETKRAHPRFPLRRSISEMSILSDTTTASSSSFRSRSTTTTSSIRKGRTTPGWYSREGELTLEEFALKLQTRSKKLELYFSKCAKNLVMALLAPTPVVVLFCLNPVSLMVGFVVVVLVGVWGWASG